MKRKTQELESQMKRIQRELLSLGDLRPGSLSKQYNVCGSPKCRCKEDPPRKHGPYYQLSFTRKGRSRTTFVKKSQLPAVRDQVRNYTRFRALVGRLVELSTQACELKLEQETS